MYPSKGSNPYGQQSYAAQQAYGQIPGSGYSGNSIGGPDGGSQHNLSSRQASILGSSQEADIGGFRTHTSQTPQYGGPYAAVYGSSTIGGAQQITAIIGKGAGSSSGDGRSGYASTLPESSKFSSGALGSSLGMNGDDYVSAGYGGKAEQFPAAKSYYASMDRKQYAEHSAYIGRELQSDSARRYAESVGLSQQHQSEMHNHMDEVFLLRQQQMLQTQSLQSGADMRPADYLAARSAGVHGPQDLVTYGGRMDAEPRTLSLLGSSPYGVQHPTIGGASRRNVDDLIYAQGSSSSGYGVGLPPGRDYVAGKGFHSTPLESEYQGSVLSRGGHSSIGVSMVEERKDDRSGLRRELAIRDEERHRELVRERERERDRERDREHDRERDRDRERERERERQRGRDRLLERRDKEKERERKRGPELRRERTPPRITKDRQVSSVSRDERPSRRVSPRRETSHRRHSPVKEKRREYICKVHPFCLVDVERDYLSISKRYPRLLISPDFCKVVLSWPKEELNISLRTPVSFEHELVEVDNEAEQKGLVPLVEELGKPKSGSTVWNAKVILLSGVSRDALEELCSEKNSDDRIAHLNNFLKFAVLRKEHAFMAIGGPWNVVTDGGDPSIDESSLIRTAIRCLKDLTQLDLQSCQHWNRFLEIHYDRVGKDGLFSHKEVTVLFLPDLSDSLPALDLWKSQWFAHKKNAVEREEAAKRREKKSSEKKDALQGDQESNKSEKDIASEKNINKEDDVRKEKVEKMEGLVNEVAPGAKKVEKVSNDSKGNAAELKEKCLVTCDKEISKEDGDSGNDGNNNVEKVHDGTSEVKKAGKKRVVKKVPKGKVAVKKENVEDMVSKHDEKMDEKDIGGEQGKLETTAHQEDNSAEPASVKTFVRKKIMRKVPVGKSAQKEDKSVDASDISTEKNSEKGVEPQDDKTEGKKELDETSSGMEKVVKTVGKKKIIKRVIKRKIAVSVSEDKGALADCKKVGEKTDIITDIVTKTDNMKGQIRTAEECVDMTTGSDSKSPESKAAVVENQDDGASAKNIHDGKEDTKKPKPDENDPKGDKANSRNDIESEAAKHNDSEKNEEESKKKRTKDEKEKKRETAKNGSRQKSGKEVKEKVKSEEPPKHPGFFLQTKRSKESKIRSMSLSLGGLLDYNDKDIEESTFELSLFAESLNEMLQYQMGCRLLAFLEKLRIRFVAKRNQRKRERDDQSKENDKKESLHKRRRLTDDSERENESAKSENEVASNLNHGAALTKEDTSAAELGVSKMEIRTKADDDVEDNAEDDAEDNDEDMEEEDPEENSDEDAEMGDAIPSNDVVQEQAEIADHKTELEAKPENETIEDGSKKQNADEKKMKEENTEKDEKLGGEKNKDKGADSGKNIDAVKDQVLDKELMQAFRYFDRNRVGYIRVEDLRCIIHGLGKFLSHRDVKEMIQSALLESNNTRDNRIHYNKLVRLAIADI